MIHFDGMSAHIDRAQEGNIFWHAYFFSFVSILRSGTSHMMATAT
jgi:hypothetical protein